MQKLEGRNTYTPTDIPHIRGNCDLPLNREETLSVSGLKTLSNDSDAALTATGYAGQNMSVSAVYVLNMRGEPLMPTTPRTARILLKGEKATVVRRTPFTIQLKYTTGETKQEIVLGVDSGYEHIGLSAITDKKELYSAEAKLRTNIVKLNSERRQYRRSRRNRNTWYRQARFDNRKNAEISGVEYQQGELLGYEVREYLLEKYHRTCVYCGNTDIPLEIEHIVPKSRGGSDRISNLTISCHKCNQKKGNKTADEFGYPEVQEQAKKPLKGATFMSTVRWMLVNKLRELGNVVTQTYGYITKHNRIRLGLEKSHINDAFVIAGGTMQESGSITYLIQQVRKCNRKLFKGDRSHIKNTAPRYIHGLQKLDGTKVHASAKVKEITILQSASTFLIEIVQRGTLLHTLKSVVSATPAPHGVL